MKKPQRHIHRSYDYTSGLLTQSDIVTANILSADKIKISELPQASQIDGDDIIPFVSINGTDLETQQISISEFMDNVCNVSLLPSGENIKFDYINDTLYISTSPTGSYASLRVNNIPVSLNGHIHTTNDIMNFGSGVSGLIPTDAPNNHKSYVRKNNTWADVSAPNNLKFFSITSIDASGVTPQNAEPVWKSDIKTLSIGDGVTLGGINIGPNLPLRVVSLNSVSSITLNIPTVPPPQVIRVSPSNPFSLGGLSAPGSDTLAEGGNLTSYELLMINIGQHTITIKNQMPADPETNPTDPDNPLEKNRIITPNGSDYLLAGGFSVRLFYDIAIQRWRVV